MAATTNAGGVTTHIRVSLKERFRPLTSWARRNAIVVLGIAGLLVVLLWLRGDVLLSSGSFNPDEAELLGEAKRALLSPIPYDTFTTSTHLLVWPYFLAALHLVGLPLSLPAAHLMSGLFYVLILSILWTVLVRRLSVWTAAIGVIGPALLLLSGVINAELVRDYMALSTELLPIALLTVAAATAFMGVSPRGGARLWISTVIIGIAPWAKPSVGLLALGLWGVIIASELRGQPPASWWKSKRVAICAVGVIAPTVVFTTVMLVGGTFGLFLSEPISTTFSYASAGSAEGAILPGVPARLTTLTPVLIGILPLVFVSGSRLRGSLILSRWHWHHSRLAISALLGLTLLGVTSTVLSPLAFPHYAILTWGGATIATICATGLATDAPLGVSWGLSPPERWGTIIVAACACAALWPYAGTFAHGFRFASPASIMNSEITSPSEVDPGLRPLSEVCRPGSEVVAWGWSPEYYSYLNWTPASRYVISQWLRATNPRQTLYRDRFVAELQSRQPSCIVNFVGPSFFGGYGPEETVQESVPEIKPLLASCYHRVLVPTTPGPIEVFSRKPACGQLDLRRSGG